MLIGLLRVMASAIKGIVSKNKIRYKEDGFDLDLSYISRNIIAMGFPAEDLQRFYRNHIDEVVRFFESKHKDRYKVYNLCSENKRRYDKSKFHGRVDDSYSFQDHNPPPFHLLKPFCEDVKSWLQKDRNNIAAIHCKAGKGRTGVMICAFLLHQGHVDNPDSPNPDEKVQIKNAQQALDYYGKQRTHDSKGVTIPSQRRYVYYYEELVKNRLEYVNVTLALKSLCLDTIPMVNGGNFILTCDIIQLPKQKLRTYEIEVKKGKKFLCYNVPDELLVRGDIKFEFYIKKIKKEKIFQFCFNTFFIKSEDHSTNSFNNVKVYKSDPRDNLSLPINGYSNGKEYCDQTKCSCRKRSSSGPESNNRDNFDLVLVLPKNQLDKAYKDKGNKIFHSEFKVRLRFARPAQSTRSPECLRQEPPITGDTESSHGDASSDNDSDNDTDDDDEDDDDCEDEDERGVDRQTTYL